MLLDVDLVVERNRRDERLDFVKTIRAFPEDPQREINLRRSENLHLHNSLSFRAKSRNLSFVAAVQLNRSEPDWHFGGSVNRSYLKMTKMADKIIVALDVPTKKDALRLVEQLRPEISFFKIGLQLFTAEGPKSCEPCSRTGAKVFLDLKLHDIPNTVAQAVESAANLGVQMLTIHLSGGDEMIRRRRSRAKEHVDPRRDSADQLERGRRSRDIGILRQDRRTGFATGETWALKTGIDGIVASPHEIKAASAQVWRQNQNRRSGNSTDMVGNWRSKANDDAARSARGRRGLFGDRPTNHRAQKSARSSREDFRNEHR